MAINLISEKIGPEQGSILIREIKSLMEGDIRVSSKMFMHKVILSGRMVKMGTSVSVSSILPHKFLEVMHGKEFRVFPGWGVKEKSEISVDHLIISHDKSGGGELGFLVVHLILLL